MAKIRILSFRYALEGIATALNDEPNMVFHVLAGTVAVLMGCFFGISHTEWLILMLTIGMVLSIELTNTAIEETVNSFTDNVHPSAKKAKDVAAGAVLIASVTALGIGIYIFLPYIYNFLLSCSVWKY